MATGRGAGKDGSNIRDKVLMQGEKRQKKKERRIDYLLLGSSSSISAEQ